MKKIYLSFAILSIVFLFQSCSKDNNNALILEDLTPVQLLQSKTWEVYDHTRNGALHWQGADYSGGVTFQYASSDADIGTVIWETKNQSGVISSKCLGEFEIIDDSNVLNTFTSAKCEMGNEAFILVVTPQVDGLLLNGTIQGDSWIMRLR